MPRKKNLKRPVEESYSYQFVYSGTSYKDRQAATKAVKEEPIRQTSSFECPSRSRHKSESCDCMLGELLLEAEDSRTMIDRYEKDIAWLETTESMNAWKESISRSSEIEKDVDLSSLLLVFED